MNLQLFLNTNNISTEKPQHPTPQDYFDYIVSLFNKYELKSENLNELQIKTLEEIIENKKIIEENLKPLKNICNYEFSLVGGALRDLYLGKENLINDYDFVISPGYPSEDKLKKLISLAENLNLNIHKNNKELEEIKNFRIEFKKKQYETEGADWASYVEEYLIESIETEYYFSKIIKYLMKDIPNIKHFHSKSVEEKYMNAHIGSINQFIGVNNKKVDVIVSEYGGMNFLSTFDIELCKLFIDMNKINSKEDIIENIIPTGSMLRDVEDKTLSINAVKFSNENLSYFFSKHLLKLLEKYPDYKINLFVKEKIDPETKEVKELNMMEKERLIFAQQLKLSFELPEKGIKAKKLKI